MKTLIGSKLRPFGQTVSQVMNAKKMFWKEIESAALVNLMNGKKDKQPYC